MNPWKDIQAVRLGEYVVAKEQGRLAALGLGSCIALMLHDAHAGVGGMAHVVLPARDSRSDASKPAKYAEDAVPVLIEEMKRQGATVDAMTARLVGGACMFATLLPKGVIHMGERNVLSCRQALKQIGIPIVGEDIGDEYGRSVVFDVAAGSVTVRSVSHGERRV